MNYLSNSQGRGFFFFSLMSPLQQSIPIVWMHMLGVFILINKWLPTPTPPTECANMRITKNHLIKLSKHKLVRDGITRFIYV